VRHAPGARATADVAVSGTGVRVEVTDEGNPAGHDGRPGFMPGHGIAGMRERVAAFGGSLAAGPRPGGGYRVLAQIPLEDGKQAVELAGRLAPDVVVMDVRMPVMDGIEATQRITGAQAARATRVLILTTFDLDEIRLRGAPCGASGFALKSRPLDELLSAIRIVAAGEALLAPSVTSFRPTGLDAITPFHIATDYYRDVAYPGGVFNSKFMNFYAAYLVKIDKQTAGPAIGAGDRQCLKDFCAHVRANWRYSIGKNAPANPFDDSYWHAAPGSRLNRIEVSILGCQSWQDGVVSSRATELYYDTFMPGEPGSSARTARTASASSPSRSR
jgi:CheY-like chemotaxis protein